MGHCWFWNENLKKWLPAAIILLHMYWVHHRVKSSWCNQQYLVLDLHAKILVMYRMQQNRPHIHNCAKPRYSDLNRKVGTFWQRIVVDVETFSRVHAFTWCGRLAPLLRSLTPEASQLRIYVSTFNLRFNHLNGDHLGAVEVNNQKPLLLLQQLPATAALHKVSALNFISPQKGNPT